MRGTLALAILTALISLASTGAFADNSKNAGDFFKGEACKARQTEAGFLLGNDRIELALGQTAGGLVVESITDLASGQVYPSGAGAALLELASAEEFSDPGQALLAARMSRTASEGWQEEDFDDTGWEELKLPFRTDEENATWYLRLPLPPGTRQVTFSQALDDEADIWAGGKLLLSVKPEEGPWGMTYKVEVPEGASSLAIRLTGHGHPNGIYGPVTASSTARSRQRADLASGFLLESWKQTETSAGMEVTFNLVGNQPETEGLTCALHYGLFKGDQPWVTTWVDVASATQGKLLTEVSFPSFSFPEKSGNDWLEGHSQFTRLPEPARAGLVSGVFSYLGQRELKGQLARCWYSPMEALSEQPFETRKALFAVVEGDRRVADFTVQLFSNYHYVKSSPRAVPPLYNTWFGYYAGITADQCYELIPLAREIGCQYFVIDDGWQKSALTEDGGHRFGDWVIDYAKFPEGLRPVSDATRKAGMKFGIWMSPIMTSPNTQNATEHADWLITYPDGSIQHEWGSHLGMCMASDWGDWLTNHFVGIAKEAKVDFFKCDSGLFHDGCTGAGHDHLPGQSVAAQVESWTAFGDALRKARPGFIVDRGWEGGPEVCDMQEEGWFGDWAIGYDPSRMDQLDWWYKNADIYRRSLYSLASTRPSFCIAWETPCHTPPASVDALEYHFTTIGAFISNVEIHGKLPEMTPEEQAAITKWINWNWENREFLQYTQILTEPTWDSWDEGVTEPPHIDAIAHLRNELKGKFGFLCMWNPGPAFDTITLKFNTADYLVDLPFDELELWSLKRNRPVEFTHEGATLIVPDYGVKARGWDILEVRRR